MKHRIPSFVLVAALALMASASVTAQENQPAQAERPAVRVPILRLDAGGPVSQITSLVFADEGKTLYAAGWDKAVYAWTRDAQGQFQIDPAKMLRIPIGPDVSGTINAMALSSDGKYLAVAGRAVGKRFTGFTEGGLIFPASAQSKDDLLDSGTIYVFNLKAQADEPALISLRGHMGTVLFLAFAPSQAGRPAVLVSAAEETENGKSFGAVRVWDLKTPTASVAVHSGLASVFTPSKPPRGIAALRLGATAKDVLVGIAWGDDVFRVWNPANGNVVEVKNHRSFVCGEVNNEFLIAGGLRLNGNEWKYQLGLWKPPVNGPNQAPTLEAPSFQDGTVPVGLAKASGANVLLNITANPKTRQLGFFLADSTTLKRLPATAADVTFADVIKSQPPYAISPQGDLVAVAANVDGTIKVFANNQFQNPQVLAPQGKSFPLVRFYKNGESLGLWLGRDANAQNADDLIFDLTAGQIAANAGGWNADPANAGLTATPNQQNGRRTLVINLGQGQTSTILLPKNQTFNESQIAFCPRTENHPPLVGLIVTSPDFAETVLRVYNAETGDRLRQFSGHTDAVTSIAFSSDGKLLASAGLDRTVRLWWMEDLKDHIGRKGFLDYLTITDIDDKPTVNEIDPFAAADLKNALEAGDVLEGFARPNGEFQPAKKSLSFYYYLSSVPPVVEVENQPKQRNKVKLHIVRGGQKLQPEVQVQQGVDERKPLATLFFKEGEAGQPASWIGWSPLGPFQSSDPGIENLVGWHLNPPKPDDPNAQIGVSNYSPLAQYPEHRIERGLFKSLIETGDFPKAAAEPGEKPEVSEVPVELPEPEQFRQPARPRIELTLFIHETKEIEKEIGNVKQKVLERTTLTADDEQRIWAETKNLKAIFSVEGDSSPQLLEKIAWRIDGKVQDAKNVREIFQGLYEVDLSGFDWQPKENDGSYALVVDYKDDAVPLTASIEQAIVFAPPKPPVVVEKKLPLPSIREPISPMDLYDHYDPRETEITVNLSKVDEAPTLSGLMLFELNGKTVEREGKPLTREFDENTTQIKEMLPLENGRNKIRIRLESSDGSQKRVSADTLVIEYRRLPQGKIIEAKADPANPRAVITAEINTPEDRPLTDLLIDINGKEYPIPAEELTKTQDETDKTLWKVVVSSVPISAGKNTVRILPQNADGWAFSAPMKEVAWTPPPAAMAERRPPDPPSVYFAFNTQAPLAGYWQGDDYTVPFNVIAPGKLTKVEVEFNGQSVATEIPPAAEKSKYEFRVPVRLTKQINQLQVSAWDEHGRKAEVWTPMTLLKPPFLVQVDELEVLDATTQKPMHSIKPNLKSGKAVSFNAPAKSGRVVLKGKVVTSDTSVALKRPFVKCWVNGFLQRAQAVQDVKSPTDWKFEMDLTLNLPKNILHLELPEAPEDARSSTRCIVECAAPETKQNLRVLVVGIDPAADQASLDAVALEKQAREAFGVQNGKSEIFEKARFYPVRGDVGSAQINATLERIQAEVLPNAEAGEHDVVVVYYQGKEVLNKQGDVVFETQDATNARSALTDSKLKDKLNEMYGAHLVLLDLAQPSPLPSKLKQEPFLGFVKSVHQGNMPQNAAPLLDGLEKALPKTKELGQLPKNVQAEVGQSIDDNVPADLKQIVIGPGQAGAGVVGAVGP